MSDISLSLIARQTLDGLERTSRSLEQSSLRLATGLRVQQVADDPVAFFRMAGLERRADIFSERKDGIRQAISTMDATMTGVESMDKMLGQIKGLVGEMKGVSTAEDFQQSLGTIQMLVEQYDQLAADASYGGVNLLTSTTQRLEVPLGDVPSRRLVIRSEDLLSRPLGEEESPGSEEPSKIQAALDWLKGIDFDSAFRSGDLSRQVQVGLEGFLAAQEDLGASTARFGYAANILETRADFSEQYANVLRGGAAKLGLADPTEEVVNLITAQTRFQLGLKTVAITNDMESELLNLLKPSS